MPPISTPNWGTASPNMNFSGGPSTSHLPRPVAIRLVVVHACKELTAQGHGVDGFHDVGTILQHIPHISPPPMREEVLDICETEGNAQNGGGEFDVQNGNLIKWQPTATPGLPGLGGPGGAVGQIGSPGMSHPSIFSSFGAPGQRP